MITTIKKFISTKIPLRLPPSPSSSLGMNIIPISGFVDLVSCYNTLGGQVGCFVYLAFYFWIWAMEFKVWGLCCIHLWVTAKCCDSVYK